MKFSKKILLIFSVLYVLAVALFFFVISKTKQDPKFSATLIQAMVMAVGVFVPMFLFKKK